MKKIEIILVIFLSCVVLCSSMAQSIHKMPQGGKLYYFISFSMPDALIRTYVQDALQYHGRLVLRGIEKGKNFHDFILHRIRPLVQYRPVEIDIDPRLFDVYHISMVPSIVLVLPNGAAKKISGSVSTHWALQRFSERNGVL